MKVTKSNVQPVKCVPLCEAKFSTMSKEELLTLRRHCLRCSRYVFLTESFYGRIIADCELSSKRTLSLQPISSNSNSILSAP
jgi:hypothetical protein